MVTAGISGLVKSIKYSRPTLQKLLFRTRLACNWQFSEMNKNEIFTEFVLQITELYLSYIKQVL